MMATPSSPLNSASPEPQEPKARKKLQGKSFFCEANFELVNEEFIYLPSGWKIWIRLLPESATQI